MDIDNEKGNVKLHFIDWKKAYDEWLPFDSQRIHTSEDCPDGEESFYESQEVGSIGAAIGRLIFSVDVKNRPYVSKYDIRLPFDENCRNFN